MFRCVILPWIFAQVQSQQQVSVAGCCPEKRVTGSLRPELDGTYILDGFDYPELPDSCSSACVYRKEGEQGSTKYCFKPSKEGQAECSGPSRGPDMIVAAMKALDFEAVKKDLAAVLTDSKPWWPADYGNYGPLMIRLAWHSAGSYRRSDGRGGSDGARQRFDPERSWDDNTNLDKARSLLWPIKEKYGIGLSWGDLIILAGNVAIETMGLPLLGFCAGRLDDSDGSASNLLGPTGEQEHLMHCVLQGDCKEPLGAGTVGLIYVNPEGFMANGDPAMSAHNIREVFSWMSMNDSETVALIGGGHAFGKAHGACPLGAGKSPKEDPVKPWAGNCGSGQGEDTTTSGLELPWTTTPTVWSNQYFTNLKDLPWENFTGPGDKHQWRVEGQTAPTAPSAGGSGTQDIGMLTSDVALLHDPIYKELVEKFAEEPESLNHAFSHAWYKLTTRDMGPPVRCLGKTVPPPQPWQNALPAPPVELPDYQAVRDHLEEILGRKQAMASMWVRLAWRCMATFRQTDYLGGCNGARLLLSPQKDWPVNSGLDTALAALAPHKEAHGPGLSWADLIQLAGSTALQHLGLPSRLPFCGGRVDATEDNGASDFLMPKLFFNYTDSLAQLNEVANLKGLSQRDLAVLNAAGFTIGAASCKGLFCQRPGGEPAQNVSNAFFTMLLSHRWAEYTESGAQLYKAEEAELFVLPTDLMYTTSGVLRVITEDYARDNSKFLRDLGRAWHKLSIADRFDGPAGNICGHLNVPGN